MLKVYHAPNTRSIRVLWLLEELGVPYDKETVEFNPAYLQSPKHLAIHPLGKVPAIDDEGLILNESGAIVQYILAKHAGSHLEPKLGTPAYGKYLQWLHFAEATVMPPIGQIVQHSFRKPKEERIPAVVDDAKATLAKLFKLLDHELEGRDYICGETFTAADIMLGYDLNLCKLIQVSFDEYPNLSAYFERLSARPAFKRATVK
ncbi:MAG: glutathione S-transferase family protein [Parvibaculum sp.]|nr:glutathione S-transferase family protein [Parvibaculum sp.]